MRIRLIAALVFSAAVRPCLGQDLFAGIPVAPFDVTVPALATGAGVGWGELTDPEQIVRFARALADASPARVRLREIGRSVEGRPLLLLLVSSPANLARLDELPIGLAELGDARRTDPARAAALAASLPAVVWFGGSIHGDEPSGGDAALALAYGLAAGRSREVMRILDNIVVVIDPAQNPDGRARFVSDLTRARGVAGDAERDSAEHDFPWPGGRFSHHLFDLNRDWFALTHPESTAQVAAMNALPPTVVVDLHEMAADAGYFFAPPARPIHPLLGREHAELWTTVGRALAGAFDTRGWRYWTRETFDAFYPGYGEMWPSLGGALGMTYEQAGVDGQRVRLEDDSELGYREAVEHHLVAAWTTCLAVAADRQRYLMAWSSFRRAAVEDGRTGESKALALAGASRRQLAELADLLVRQGLEVSARRSPAGEHSVVVPLAQPLGRLARALLERGAPLGAEFEREQERRDARRRPDEIYDLTAWSLPLLWNVEASPLKALPPAGELAPVVVGAVPGGAIVGTGEVAFLARWDGLPAARALASLLRADVKVHVAAKAFTLEGRRWEPGTLVVRRSSGGSEVVAALERVARDTGVDFVRTASTFADEGIDLGSNKVLWVRRPRVAVAWDEPTRPTSAGGVRFTLEQGLGYPVSVVRTVRLAEAELGRFDVLILPDAGRAYGGYAGVLGEEGVRRLKSWVEEGGVLIAVGEGAAFLCQEKVGLLASTLEKRGEEAKAATTKSAGETTAGEGEPPPAVPGAVLRVELDGEELLAAGFPRGVIAAVATSPRIFTPLKVKDGRNVGVYAAGPQLVEAGFVLQASRAQLPGKAFMVVQPRGRGQVVGFAEDPALRGFARSTMLLLANAVFFASAL